LFNTTQVGESINDWEPCIELFRFIEPILQKRNQMRVGEPSAAM
jgi:hypothetical protein